MALSVNDYRFSCNDDVEEGGVLLHMGPDGVPPREKHTLGTHDSQRPIGCRMKSTDREHRCDPIAMPMGLDQAATWPNARADAQLNHLAAYTGLLDGSKYRSWVSDASMGVDMTSPHNLWRTSWIQSAADDQPLGFDEYIPAHEPSAEDENVHVLMYCLDAMLPCNHHCSNLEVSRHESKRSLSTFQGDTGGSSVHRVMNSTNPPFRGLVNPQATSSSHERAPLDSILPGSFGYPGPPDDLVQAPNVGYASVCNNGRPADTRDSAEDTSFLRTACGQPKLPQKISFLSGLSFCSPLSSGISSSAGKLKDSSRQGERVQERGTACLPPSAASSNGKSGPTQTVWDWKNNQDVIPRKTRKLQSAVERSQSKAIRDFGGACSKCKGDKRKVI